MARGNMPRQPSRSGRQEGARRTTASQLKPARTKNAPARPKAGRAQATVGKASKAAAPRKKIASATRDAASRVSTYDPLAPERVQQIIAGLDQMYPGVTCALTHRSAWELLVATILSAQSTDVRVNMVTPGLFAKYPTVQDFAALEPEQLQPDIYSTGFFRNKAKSVVGAARRIVADFGGNVPQTMEELLTLPGVARKTANVVLGTWFKQNEGVVVDTHVTRISRRLELTKQDDPKKIEEDLMRIIPRDRWTDFSHEVIWHGRKLCVARSPKCADCGLEKLCHAADKTWSTVGIHPEARL
ncbi:MAG: endonuclease III [Terriglobales bacterium]